MTDLQSFFRWFPFVLFSSASIWWLCPLAIPHEFCYNLTIDNMLLLFSCKTYHVTVKTVLVIESKPFLWVTLIKFKRCSAPGSFNPKQQERICFTIVLCVSIHMLCDCPHFIQDASARGWEGAAEQGVTGKEDTGCHVTEIKHSSNPSKQQHPPILVL